MQGYILHVQKAKNEDVVATILTAEHLYTLYRFYGARHPIVTAGYKIDFEIERDGSPFLPRLRHLLHLGFPWLVDRERFQIWQHFIALLYDHLRDVENPGRFYYELLEKYAAVWHLQNPKRSAVEAYLQILRHEGRLHALFECFVCNRPLEGTLSLARAYLPAHPACVVGPVYRVETIETLMNTGTTIHLEDKEVDALWLTLLEGM